MLLDHHEFHLARYISVREYLRYTLNAFIMTSRIFITNFYVLNQNECDRSVHKIMIVMSYV